MTPAPLLVVLRPLGLGDFLTAVPAYRALARAYPEHRRVLAAPRALHDLAALTGAFAAAVDVRPLAPLPPVLRRAALAVDLHGRGPASQRVLVASGAERLIAFACAEVPETRGGAAWDAGEHEVARWCRMLAHAGIAADPADLALAPPALRADARNATIVHPGAQSGARRWPAERFAAVARDERRRGRRVLVTGSLAERPLALEVARCAGLVESEVVAGRTSALDLAALVAHAGRVVCGDTGIAHLATAFGTPSVVLFGPTPPRQWGPPARPCHRVLWRGMPGDPHGTRLDPGLAAIGVDDVLAALADLPRLARGRVGTVRT